MRQDAIAKGLHPSLHGADAGVRLPELQQFVFPLQPPSHLEQQAAIPLLGFEITADRCEIEHGDACAIFAQPGGGAHHKAGFAHLARGQHVTETARPQPLVQFAVRPLLYWHGYLLERPGPIL